MNEKRKIRVFIEGQWISHYAKMFMSCPSYNFIGVKDPEKADIIVFTGGADIDPAYYGENVLKGTFIDSKRDAANLQLYCDAHDKLKIGICRGAQFLNVMSGGTLWQDVSDHKESHHIYSTLTGERIWSSSTHHQMMRPTDKARIIATAARAMVKKCDGEIWERPSIAAGISNIDPNARDVEVCWYEHTKSFCFQPHPELNGFNALRKFFFDQVGVAMLQAKV